MLDGCWYVDFPHWPFPHDNLAMVSGADKLLELLSDGDLFVKVNVIPANKQQQHEGYIELIQTEHSLLGGSTYQVMYECTGGLSSPCALFLFVIPDSDEVAG